MFIANSVIPEAPCLRYVMNYSIEIKQTLIKSNIHYAVQMIPFVDDISEIVFMYSR